MMLGFVNPSPLGLMLPVVFIEHFDGWTLGGLRFSLLSWMEPRRWDLVIREYAKMTIKKERREPRDEGF